MQKPRQRLKFEILLTVFLAHTHIASLSDYRDSKVAEIIVRHKTVSVRAEGCSPAVINPRKAEGKVFL